MILIGEPTSVDRLGDIVKIGRRGSVNMWIEVPGVQGHVAYPDRANQSRRAARPRDCGAGCAPPRRRHRAIPAVQSRIHGDLDTPTDASNVIPGSATAQLNIRFNNLHRGADLVKLVEEIAEREAPGAKVRARISGEAFLTPAGRLYDVVVEAIEEETGIATDLSTSGGTSDGRFLIQLCPVVDFGLPNATMHKVGECAAVEDIRVLSRIYERILGKVFS